MTDFVYPVNDRDPDKWGDDEDVLSVFRGIRAGDQVNWLLGNSQRLVQAGDRIWVRASLPLARLVGVGLAVNPPKSFTVDDKIMWCIDIRWDKPVIQVLLAHETPADLFVRVQSTRRVQPDEAERLETWLENVGAPQPESLPAGRLKRLREVTVRQGQEDFRQKLMIAYDRQCALTGCAVEAALQAAHIAPYDGLPTNRVTNGLLLRADVHNLFDKGLIWFDGNYRVHLDDGARDHYGYLEGRRLRPPAAAEHRPDKEALREHRVTIALR